MSDDDAFSFSPPKLQTDSVLSYFRNPFSSWRSVYLYDDQNDSEDEDEDENDVRSEFLYALLIFDHRNRSRIWNGHHQSDHHHHHLHDWHNYNYGVIRVKAIHGCVSHSDPWSSHHLSGCRPLRPFDLNVHSVVQIDSPLLLDRHRPDVKTEQSPKLQQWWLYSRVEYSSMTI